MDDKAILQAACKLLGVAVEDVLTYKVYEDHVALVVNPGPKHKVPLADLPKPEPKSAPKPRGRHSKGAKDEAKK